MAGYDALHAAATDFVKALAPSMAGSNKNDSEHFLSCIAPDFRMSWGHKMFVSGRPALQGELSSEEFIQHLSKMVPGLETWRIEIQEPTVIDTRHNKAVVRADFYMTPKGEMPVEDRTVLNDIVFILSLDDTGKKVKSATEFIDPIAATEIGRLMSLNQPKDV